MERPDHRDGDHPNNQRCDRVERGGKHPICYMIDTSLISGGGLPECSQGQAFGGRNNGRGNCEASDNRDHCMYNPPLPLADDYRSVLK